MRKLAVLLSVVLPGAGQWLLGRPVHGIFLFAVYNFSLMVILYRALLLDTAYAMSQDRVLCLAVGAAVAAWGCALVDMLRGFSRKREKTKPIRDELIRKGMIFYLRGEFDRAAERFAEALRLDRGDVDARFHLAMTMKAQGRRGKARRMLKACLAFDTEGKWYSEIAEEIEALSR